MSRFALLQSLCTRKNSSLSDSRCSQGGKGGEELPGESSAEAWQRCHPFMGPRFYRGVSLSS